MKGVVRSIDAASVAGKRVLVRADLNVPLRDGRVGDATRIERVVPTLSELAGRGARVIVCSHLGRPGGKPKPELSLAVLVPVLAAALGRPVQFAPDCIGAATLAAAERLKDGEVLLLENTRFHPEEEANEPGFAAALAKVGEIYVNDAFSASHRAHASTEGVAHLLPAYAGRLMQAELAALDSALGHPKRPAGALVGGAKVSTKLKLLGNLVSKVDFLLIGGAMANTFLAAEGVAVGRSLEERDQHAEARTILDGAKASGCAVLLPRDAVVATRLEEGIATRSVAIDAVPAEMMILDIGPETVGAFKTRLGDLKTLVWNGPVGAFETAPFAAGTIAIAHAVAEATERGLCSVAGGGDTVAALNVAKVTARLTYVSTAGGAFLEWLEGRTLPGVAALMA